MNINDKFGKSILLQFFRELLFEKHFLANIIFEKKNFLQRVILGKMVFKKEATVSDSLSSLFKKELSWANWYHRFKKKSDCEQIALVTLYLRTTVSESLSIESLKKHILRMFLTVFHSFSYFVWQQSKLFPSLFVQLFFFNDGRDWFAFVALYKRATVSE